jgi:uncharacterized coiled-coil protein SlyX
MSAAEEPSVSPAPRRFKLPIKVRDAVLTVGGMVLGALVGTGVQQVLARTGVLGPGVSSLIAEQQENFAEVNTKLDSLRQLSTDPAAQRALTELSQLLAQQGALAAQTEQQLKLMSSELTASKDRELAERGMAGGADFWLKAGESHNLGSRDQVFALQVYQRGVALVNLSGTARRLAVGDVIEFMAGDRACKVFFKQATPREDGRVGFDLDCG